MLWYTRRLVSTDVRFCVGSFHRFFTLRWICFVISATMFQKPNTHRVKEFPALAEFAVHEFTVPWFTIHLWAAHKPLFSHDVFVLPARPSLPVSSVGFLLRGCIDVHTDPRLNWLHPCRWKVKVGVTPHPSHPRAARHLQKGPEVARRTPAALLEQCTSTARSCAEGETEPHPASQLRLAAFSLDTGSIWRKNYCLTYSIRRTRT